MTRINAIQYTSVQRIDDVSNALLYYSTSCPYLQNRNVLARV